jgi:uroporphyrin-III C-methyltransferase
VVFVTGHQCAANTDALDWGALARLRATLCFYMGVRRLPEIAHNLLHHGMPADMPLALISEATRPTQKITLSTLGAAEKMAPDEIVQPALVVIGEVVRLADFAERVPGMVG